MRIIGIDLTMARLRPSTRRQYTLALSRLTARCRRARHCSCRRYSGCH